MKLKKVAALCSSANAFCLFDRVDGDGVVTQWLGDGCCAFPLHGLPVLSEPELYRMFDVSEKKQDKIYFNHSALPESLNVEDWCRSEVRAEDMDVTISSGGKVPMPLRFPGGLLFIQSKYLGPLEDQMDFLELYVRRSDSGGRYVVAKTGMGYAGRGRDLPGAGRERGLLRQAGRTGVNDAAGAGQASGRAAGG